ncbi:hypothetical protein, partial [Rhizobium sp. ZW T2_16]|uniref:hypothetical protein n=1 Tax=Rhizobium sp. ZW T2_16 TaxID=3378083 RepID=UPI00385188BA
PPHGLRPFVVAENTMPRAAHGRNLAIRTARYRALPPNQPRLRPAYVILAISAKGKTLNLYLIMSL